MDPQPIRLSVPASPEYARPVRMLAASLASVGGMSVDDVEDLRMAAEEGFVYACATGLSTVDASFAVAERSVAIDFSLGADAPPADDPSLSYAELLLGAVCDLFEVDAEAGQLHLAKTGGDDAD